MLGNPVNEKEVNFLSAGSDLDLYMGKVSIMAFASVDKGCVDLSLALVSKLYCWDPFPVKIKFAFGGKPDNIILLEIIQFQEHLVVIISSVHDESGFSKQVRTAFRGGESDVINGREIFFSGRMDLGENADRMIIIYQYAGFCHMIAFFIDIFCIGT